MSDKKLDDAMRALREQMLIVCMKRLAKLGSPLDFHVSEVDDTGQDMLGMSVDGSVFHFELSRKQ